MLNGKDFIARTRFTKKDGTVLVQAGETCEKLPAAILQAHLDAGEIVPAPEKPRGKKGGA